jgi:SHAQKYF class myb-like DNA-binding protein
VVTKLLVSLGLEAVPKKILEIMKVKHLTREQVASHLQVITNSDLCSCTQYMRARQKYHLHLVNYPA